MEKSIARVIFLWISIICILFGYMISKNKENHLFQFGPNPELFILGICIDDPLKYSIVVSFCFVNSGIRTLNHNILQPWIINIVQDPKNDQIVNYKTSYEISFISTIYNWFDFFMYMNILMSQIDMLIIETATDVIMTFITTTYYLRIKNKINVLTDMNV